jgi:hypothetical protein
MFGKISALVASSFIASDAQAAGWIVGLVDGKSIVTIDPATRKVMSKVDVKGAVPSSASTYGRPTGCSTALPAMERSSRSMPNPARPR